MTNARLHLAAVTATASTATTVFALHPPALSRTGAAGVAMTTAWLVALALGTWLALSSGAALLTVVCVGRAPSRVARFAPAFVRRLVEIALVGSCIVGSTVPASATSRGTRRDIPVVRTPAAVTTTTPPTTAARPISPTTAAATSRSRTTARPSAPARVPSTTVPASHVMLPRSERGAHPAADAPARAAIPPVSRHYTVQPGDNLWTIARAALGGNAGDAEVAPYWNALISANRSHLRSGDPNLIYPGELLGLPDRGANQ